MLLLHKTRNFVCFISLASDRKLRKCEAHNNKHVCWPMTPRNARDQSLKYDCCWLAVCNMSCYLNSQIPEMINEMILVYLQRIWSRVYSIHITNPVRSRYYPLPLLHVAPHLPANKTYRVFVLPFIPGSTTFRVTLREPKDVGIEFKMTQGSR